MKKYVLFFFQITFALLILSSCTRPTNSTSEKAILDLHKQNLNEKTPIVDHDEKTDRYGLRYSELISPLIKAVQDLGAENTTLKTEVADLNARLEQIEKLIKTN
jgi:hypothetical protein